MIIQHRSETQAPNLEGVADRRLQDVFKSFFRLIYEMSNRIYADLVNLERVERVSALPTAEKQYRGKLFLKSAAGEDTLHICVLNSGTGVYSWKQVGLT